MATEDHHAQFVTLQNKFLTGLAQRQQDLNKALGADNPKAVTTAVLHRLVGAAGIFGYPDLGNLAQATMKAIEVCDEKKTAELVVQLQVAITALSMTVDKETL